MSIGDAMQIVGTFGFPILVALYYMFKLEKRLIKLDDTIGLLTLVLARSTGQDVAQLRAEFLAGNGDGD